MKTLILAAVVVLGSTAFASAHTHRMGDEPIYGTSSSIGAWRFAVPLQRSTPDCGTDRCGTLTGGPVGGPNQS